MTYNTLLKLVKLQLAKTFCRECDSVVQGWGENLRGWDGYGDKACAEGKTYLLWGRGQDCLPASLSCR